MSAPAIGSRFKVYQVRDDGIAPTMVGTVVALDADGARRKAFKRYACGTFSIGFDLRCERWCEVRPGAHTSAAECAPYLLPDRVCGVCGVSHGCPERDDT